MPTMPQTERRGQPAGTAEEEEVVLAVDRHKDTQVAAVITAVGVLVASPPFPATAAGYRQLLSWARGFGLLRRAGVEGTGCYGAALTRFLRAGQVEVVEVNRPDRAARRRAASPMRSTPRPPPAPSWPVTRW